MLTAHVAGYSQKKKLVAGLKDLLTRVETAENKLYLAKNLGKARSKLEGEEQALADNHSSLDLKEKIQAVNASVQAMIDEGRLTLEERPVVHEQLLARRTAAKVDGKAKLLEKLENMLSSVAKAQPVELPVPNLEEIYPAHVELKEIHRYEKRPAKSLGTYERGMLSKKAQIEEAINKWSAKNRMWFENQFEFQPRLERAFDTLAKEKAAQKIREEEEALERKRKAEEEALEQKRIAHQQAEERKAKELEEKLEAKRMEAASKPQKAAPQPKKKEKVKRVVLDNRELFAPPPRTEGEEEAPRDDEGHLEAQDHDSLEGSTEVREAHGGESKEDSEEGGANDSPRAPEAAAKAKGAAESIWESPGVAPVAQDGGDADAHPSLGVAAKEKPAPRAKIPPPQPKKKEKKKFTKLAANDLGFDCDNPNFLN